MQINSIKNVGLSCKEFREKTLQVSLTDFCKIVSENIKNVSAFENGRANNIKYLFLYYGFDSRYSDDFISQVLERNKRGFC